MLHDRFRPRRGLYPSYGLRPRDRPVQLNSAIFSSSDIALSGASGSLGRGGAAGCPAAASFSRTIANFMPLRKLNPDRWSVAWRVRLGLIAVPALLLALAAFQFYITHVTATAYRNVSDSLGRVLLSANNMMEILQNEKSATLESLRYAPLQSRVDLPATPPEDFPQ